MARAKTKRVFVCRLDDVAVGQLNVFRIPGLSWPVMAMTVNGELYVTPGICPHKGQELEYGAIVGTKVQCPVHAYRFDLVTGACSMDPTLTLQRFPITLVGDEIWADLDASWFR